MRNPTIFRGLKNTRDLEISLPPVEYRACVAGAISEVFMRVPEVGSLSKAPERLGFPTPLPPFEILRCEQFAWFRAARSRLT
jgi:hypothetical protein